MGNRVVSRLVAQTAQGLRIQKQERNNGRLHNLPLNISKLAGPISYVQMVRELKKGEGIVIFNKSIAWADGLETNAVWTGVNATNNFNGTPLSQAQVAQQENGAAIVINEGDEKESGE